ncbi:MAG TPA: hybrid sensor histidine kinase/response regulator [Coleofasciculaceae cyanobacterium]
MPLQPPHKPDHILVVDDVPDNLFLVQTLLSEQGYQVSLAEDGEIALAQIEKSPPDLVVLDIMMPKMDGYEVTRQIRQNTQLPFIPILLLTAHQQSNVVQGLDAGADDFIRKPMDVDELMARVRALLRLKHSISKQEQMARQREDFVSRLTHDLRTPLIAMDRMLMLIAQEAFGSVTPDLQEVISSMMGNNKNLIEMVNTLLEVYRHDAGQKDLTYSPCNLKNLTQEVIQELTHLAHERDISLSFNVVVDDSVLAQPALATIMGDYLELRRVLTNLVGNAIKFTEAGSVDVTLRNEFDTSDEDEGKLPFTIIEIKDTGIGISLEDQPMLFERFRHGNHKRSGSGLGLYLSHCIIQAHQGTIEVKSIPQQGTSFIIRLPAVQNISPSTHRVISPLV